MDVDIDEILDITRKCRGGSSPTNGHTLWIKNKSKDAVYHSEKILGQLYDRVERVSFVPQWQKPFDNRILVTHRVDDAILKSARQIKRKYDTAMCHIVAQQEIKTEIRSGLRL